MGRSFLFSFFSFLLLLLFLFLYCEMDRWVLPISIEELEEKKAETRRESSGGCYVVSGNGIYGATITNHLIRGEGFPYRALQVSAAISPARAVTLLPGRIRRSAYSICGRWGLTGMRKLAEVNLAVARLDIRRHAAQRFSGRRSL